MILFEGAQNINIIPNSYGDGEDTRERDVGNGYGFGYGIVDGNGHGYDQGYANGSGRENLGFKLRYGYGSGS